MRNQEARKGQTKEGQQMRYLETVTPAAAYPVTRAEALNYLKIEDDADLPVAEETLIDGLIAAATDQVEAYLGRALITQVLCLHLDDAPALIDLPRAPLQSVTAVKTVDLVGTETTESTDNYIVQTGNASRLYLKPDASWTYTSRPFDNLRITYTAGYGTTGSTVPQAIRTAILHQVAYMYEAREAVESLNKTAQMLCAQYKFYKV